MKLRELVESLDRDTDFKIYVNNAEQKGREVCKLDGSIFRDYVDFDWLMNKEIVSATVARSWGALEVFIHLDDNEKQMHHSFHQ